VSGQVDHDTVVGVEPFRVMVHLLNGRRSGLHKPERFTEVGEPVFAVKLSGDYRPAGKLGKKRFDFEVR